MYYAAKNMHSLFVQRINKKNKSLAIYLTMIAYLNKINIYVLLMELLWLKKNLNLVWVPTS